MIDADEILIDPRKNVDIKSISAGMSVLSNVVSQGDCDNIS